MHGFQHDTLSDGTPIADSEFTEYQSLSIARQHALALVPIPSAILSFCASLAIIVSIKKSRLSDEWTPYHGLLAGMTCCNIIWSITLSIGNFLYDSETAYHVFAVSMIVHTDCLPFICQGMSNVATRLTSAGVVRKQAHLQHGGVFEPIRFHQRLTIHGMLFILLPSGDAIWDDKQRHLFQV